MRLTIKNLAKKKKLKKPNWKKKIHSVMKFNSIQTLIKR